MIYKALLMMLKMKQHRSSFLHSLGYRSATLINLNNDNRYFFQLAPEGLSFTGANATFTLSSKTP